MSSAGGWRTTNCTPWMTWATTGAVPDCARLLQHSTAIARSRCQPSGHHGIWQKKTMGNRSGGSGRRPLLLLGAE